MSAGSYPDLPAAPPAPLKQHRQSYHDARVLLALVMREVTTRFGRTPGGFIWAIMQPLGQIIILGFAFSLIARNPALGTSFLLFKATGILVFQAFKTTSNMIGKSLSYSNKLLSYPGVEWPHALLARFILNIFVNLVVSILILSGIIIAENLTLIMDWKPVFLAYCLAWILSFGIGALNCYLFERVDIWSNVWGIMTGPLMIVSGVIILYEDLPPVAQEILWYNPLLHITGLMREGFYSTYTPGYISIPFVLACGMIPMVLGLMLVRKHHLYLLNR
ncbi:ABC transporter permease [Pararhodobacter marinus]|uniref:Sugar ABC transporter permease n=1 Tax=Pararhodobacter marinus TaxID=2184063 RepID=A0A2U2C770_9RHOB|nr:ABC transporter permease [Pararhodobacter marinus]PWE27745.1 sugar ABC transporter permease [Pararhodobacter marinus]